MRFFPDGIPDDVRAVLEARLPDEGACTSYAIVAGYTEFGDGAKRRLFVHNYECPVSEAIGLLEMAKFDIWHTAMDQGEV